MPLHTPLALLASRVRGAFFTSSAKNNECNAHHGRDQRACPCCAEAEASVAAMFTPWRSKIFSCRCRGRWSAVLATITCASRRFRSAAARRFVRPTGRSTRAVCWICSTIPDRTARLNPACLAGVHAIESLFDLGSVVAQPSRSASHGRQFEDRSGRLSSVRRYEDHRCLTVSQIHDDRDVNPCPKRSLKHLYGSLKTLTSVSGTKGEWSSFDLFMPVKATTFGDLPQKNGGESFRGLSATTECRSLHPVSSFVVRLGSDRRQLELLADDN
jgi:hypothetical protein